METKHVTFDDTRFQTSKDHKDKELPILEEEKEDEFSNLKNSQQVDFSSNKQCINRLLISHVRLELKHEDVLERKSDAIGIAEFKDEQDSM